MLAGGDTARVWRVNGTHGTIGCLREMGRVHGHPRTSSSRQWEFLTVAPTGGPLLTRKCAHFVPVGACPRKHDRRVSVSVCMCLCARAREYNCVCMNGWLCLLRGVYMHAYLWGVCVCVIGWGRLLSGRVWSSSLMGMDSIIPSPAIALRGIPPLSLLSVPVP